MAKHDIFTDIKEHFIEVLFYVVPFAAFIFILWIGAEIYDYFRFYDFTPLKNQINDILGSINLTMCFIFVLCVVIIYLVCKYNSLHTKYRDQSYDFSTYKRDKELEITRTINSKDREREALKNDLENKIKKLDTLLKSTAPFKKASTMVSESEVAIFNEAAHYLQKKKRPAFKAAEVIADFKKQSLLYLTQYKEMLYKYEFLLNQFPELIEYVDDIELLKEAADDVTLQEIENSYDHSRDWLTPEEYKSLSEVDKNQLALDRYLHSRKLTKRQIGEDYEMYIGWYLRNLGYKTEMYGVHHGIHDLGRDIIASRYNNNQVEIYIIQCKRWSMEKEIHENVICQLYGTTIQYILSSVKGTWKERYAEVFPVIVTTTPLSETAKEFADYLHVKVKVMPIGDYPRIKCNINNGNKIYHLPFDQQYYSTKIDKEGEFYAFTVQEAVDKGFRRAFRWRG